MYKTSTNRNTRTGAAITIKLLSTEAVTDLQNKSVIWYDGGTHSTNQDCDFMLAT